MNPAPEPYRQAPPKAVLSFMMGLCLAAGDGTAAETYLSSLMTLLAVPRAPTCPGQQR